MRRILIIDDELAKPANAELFAQCHGIKGFRFEFADGPEQARRLLADEPRPCLVLLDICFDNHIGGERYGIEILSQLRLEWPSLPVVMMSGQRDPEILIQSWDRGACGYVIKQIGCDSFSDELEEKVTRFARYEPTDLILGSSPAIQQLRQRIAVLAEYDIPVLIEGESGTGKELVAKELHRRSPRAKKQYVAVNCGSIPDSLVEAELFGTRKGAFNDAIDRMGKIEAADRGVLFLDEVAELKPPAQASLLRFLDRGEFYRIGDTQIRKADVRIVAATHCDLRSMVAEGAFRGDLYYRLNGFPLTTPALRDRPEDIPLLAHHFLEIQRDKRHKPIAGFSSEAMGILQGFGWDGNVRDLMYAVERAFILTNDGLISADTIRTVLPKKSGSSSRVKSPSEGFCMRTHLCREAWQLIRQVYLEERTHGEHGLKKRTASRLGLNPVNGFGRKLLEIRKECPDLGAEIDSVFGFDGTESEEHIG
ncbi:MAG: sigma-54 dependent transcriptional regulator [Candidatus Brocadiia bacterium]